MFEVMVNSFVQLFDFCVGERQEEQKTCYIVS